MKSAPTKAKSKEISYEKVQIADIDYYLNDRVNRKGYLEMMPVLKGIKEKILEERKWEAGFIDLIHSMTKNQFSQKQIQSSIEWWKRKVIEKRPLTKEDAKAVRMILGHLKGKS